MRETFTSFVDALSSPIEVNGILKSMVRNSNLDPVIEPKPET
jgi:hypothetical protein